MLWLAHDGSSNADWLSHYAVRFALHSPLREVRAVFVRDGSLSDAEYQLRAQYLRDECQRAGVHSSLEILPLGEGVAQALIERLPAGSDTLVLCGTRVRQRNFGLLAGTVSERLLACRRFNVLAMRIVLPGLLGNPHRLLVPVMGHPRGLGAGARCIDLLGEDLERIHVVMVRGSGGLSLWGRGLGGNGLDEAQAAQYVDAAERELRRALQHQLVIDGSLLSGIDPARGIVLAAKQHKSQLIWLGASERPLSERLLSGTPGEQVLRHAPCDVAVYRGV